MFGNSERAAGSLRVLKMREEARDFDEKLSTFQNSTLRFEHATERFFRTLEPTLRAPLPRVWTSVEGGLAEPVRATVSHEHGHTVGGDDLTTAALDEARADLHTRVMADVLQPIDQWREMLTVVEDRVPQLMKLQKQVDRRWSKLQDSRERHERRVGRERAAGEHEATTVGHRRRGGRGNALTKCFGHPGDDEFGEADSSATGDDMMDPAVAREIRREDAHVQLAQKHRKFDASLAAFREQEALVGGQLRGLAVDASWLKSYAVGALVTAKEAMQMGVVGMHSTKQPLPSFVDRCPPGIAKGSLASNVHLAAGLPRGVESGRIHPSGQATRALLLPDHVHAHRATAAPLETHARPDVSGLERVATPPAGATDVALTTAQRIMGPGSEAHGGSALAPARGAGDWRGAAGAGGYEEGRGFERRRESEEYSPAEGRISGMGGMGMAGGAGGYEEGRGYERRGGTGAGGAGRYDEFEGRGLERRREHSPAEGRVGGVGMGGGAAGAPLMARGEAVTGAPAGEGGLSGGQVCGRREFTQVENRNVLKERVERVLEHRPVEKEFVTETKYTGEHAVPSATPETPLGPVTERVVSAAAPGPKCPAGGAVSLERQDVGAGAADVERPRSAEPVAGN
ncbi:MAG: hypothetical protein J3K34DRAFT_516731 [Monoraphidium minutum]|nr:MAG: hypothetical protein J3K34DRAFT_516731 [Monoraphidium minutum]